MTANQKQFTRFLEGSDKYFIIPVYQRNYDWKEEHCMQLYNDLIDISKTNRTHFLGSIVSIYYEDGGNGSEYLIIDGQQRLTTLSLLLLAIYKVIDNGLLQTDVNKEQIKDEYLINKYSKKRVRLEPIENDKKALELLFEQEDDYISDSNITINFMRFYERILKEEITIKELFKAIKQLVIVDIELKKGEDDPQLIFESLNSTGLDLAEADKIRNFILMDKKYDTQIYLFKNYWSKIEKLLTAEVLSSFIRDYLTMKTTSIPKKDKVYIDFKNYSEKYRFQNNPEELLKDLLYYANIYSNFLNPKHDNQKINIVMKEIVEFKKTVTYPYFLHLFHEYKQNSISDITIIKSLELIRNYIFRRLICGSNNNIFTSLFPNLHKEVVNLAKNDKNKDNYYEYLVIALIDKQKNEIFPRDDEFKTNFKNKDIYKSKDTKYLLYSLESLNNRELVPISHLSIEHIMPQKITEEWKNELGVDFEKIHNKYLHTIGNLTLTGYNETLSNKSFTFKKNMFKISAIKLNTYFSNIEYWNKLEIEKRAEYIFNKIALKIWFLPEINKDLQKKANYENKYGFLEEFKSTKRKIHKIIILDEILIVDKWKEGFEQISKFLYEYNTLLFESFLSDNNFKKGNNSIISNSQSNLSKPFKLNDNIYIDSGLTSTYMLNYIRYMGKKYNLENNDITFYLKD